MNPFHEHELLQTRRQFFGRTSTGIGVAALASLLNGPGQRARAAEVEGVHYPLSTPHHPAKAKRIIYLFMAGGPSQIDMFDYKPLLGKYHKQELPASVRMGQRLTTMTSGQNSFPVVASMFKFQQYGKNGTWLSELIPHTAG
ncbi:MAG TPA: DUF1501 domain-containing protein, partial [Myxococcota bacterium]|nr:DUF1501 domain-containing protein [Myxococcota bacterium]